MSTNAPLPESPQDVIAGFYSELHQIAARLLSAERTGHTLQPAALVNELYLRLGAGQLPEWRGRTHFFATAARTLRRILIDYSRAPRRPAGRRGSQGPPGLGGSGGGLFL